ncbi:hypothetical protein [Streptomyces sp. DT203]|uniref:hypothetical protein n=1 Tax=Streptomyces sp. DT203 TaxID=3393424 RepID=UPI003CEE5E04
MQDGGRSRTGFRVSLSRIAPAHAQKAHPWFSVGVEVGRRVAVTTAAADQLDLELACRVVGAGLLAWALIGTVMALFNLQPPDPKNEPPPSFHATLVSTSRFHDRDFNQCKERLQDFGATRIEVGEDQPGQLVLTVGLPGNFTEGQSQDRLKEQMLRLSGAVDLRLCTFHTCD